MRQSDCHMLDKLAQCESLVALRTGEGLEFGFILKAESDRIHFKPERSSGRVIRITDIQLCAPAEQAQKEGR